MILATSGTSMCFLIGITLCGSLSTCLSNILDSIGAPFFTSFTAVLSDSLQVTRFKETSYRWHHRLPHVIRFVQREVRRINPYGRTVANSILFTNYLWRVLCSLWREPFLVIQLVYFVVLTMVNCLSISNYISSLR
jgi:hypothetical protein